MLAVYIICGILLVLFLLMLLPVRVEVDFREEFALTVRYAFLRIPILPGKEKPEEEPEPKPEPEPEQKPSSKKGSGLVGRLKKALKREGFWGFLQSFADFVGAAVNTSGRLLSHLKLRRFDLYLCLGGAVDAAQAAILYGQLSAAVYGACGLVFSIMPCKKKGVAVDLNYGVVENVVDFSACLSLRPIFALKAGLVILWRALLFLWKLR